MDPKIEVIFHDLADGSSGSKSKDRSHSDDYAPAIGNAPDYVCCDLGVAWLFGFCTGRVL
jgi:hypothetical protein